ncbi:MAG: NUDIX hydrolase [Nitrososphaerota archaeon]
MYNKVLTFDTAHIVPIFNDGSLLMVENYRHGVGQQILELPGGFINPGETPTHAAGRELLEETGYAARLRRYHFITPGLADAHKKTMSFVPKACLSIPARHSIH